MNEHVSQLGMRVTRLAFLAAAAALVTAVAELVMRAVQTLVLHRYIYASRDIVWMTPLADLILFGGIAVVLGIAAIGWPRLASTRVVGSVLAAVGVLSILTLQPWMAWWAMVLLAVGMGMQFGRVIARYERLVWRAGRVVIPALMLAAVGAGAVRIVGPARTERAADAALRAAQPGAPNVLLIVWDAVRASSLSLYGYPRATTPRLDAFAATGATFDRAISTASYTLPTHVSLFTGLWPHQFAASWERPLDESMPTLAEVLRERGYRTGLFSANHLFVTWEHGLLRGFAHGDDYARSAGEIARSSALVKWVMAFDWLRSSVRWYDVLGRRDADDIGGAFLRWAGRDAARPFFAFLNVYDAHHPYLPPLRFEQKFAAPGDTEADRARARELAIADPAEFNAADSARNRNMYDGAIASADDALGRLLDSLQRRGILRNTVVILVGDHGDAFGEHRAFGHGHDVYSEVTHVPMVVVFPPHVPAGLRVAAIASVRDVPATVADIAGYAGPSWPLPGRSLSRFWTDSMGGRVDTVLTEVDFLRQGEKPWYPVRRGDVRSILVWPHQLIIARDSTELYDISADPLQRRDLGAQPGFRGLRDSLQAALRYARRDAVAPKR